VYEIENSCKREVCKNVGIGIVRREATISGDGNMLSVIAKDCKEKNPVPKFINLEAFRELQTIELKYQTFVRVNQNKISVRTLVKASPNIQYCDDIKNTTRDN
jgi:hypothetical protein